MKTSLHHCKQHSSDDTLISAVSNRVSNVVKQCILHANSVGANCLSVPAAGEVAELLACMSARNMTKLAPFARDTKCAVSALVLRSGQGCDKH